jgi:hypothetical protein
MCPPGHVITSVTLPSADAQQSGSPPLKVTCAALSTSPATVLDHIALSFSPIGASGISTYFRPLLPRATSATALSLLMEVFGTGAPSSILLQAEPLNCGSSKVQPTAEGAVAAVTADVLCQGVPNDVCMCVRGALRCVTAGTANMANASGAAVSSDLTSALTLPGFVTEADLVATEDGHAPSWCQDGDDVSGWFLLQVLPCVVLLFSHSSTHTCELARVVRARVLFFRVWLATASCTLYPHLS